MTFGVTEQGFVLKRLEDIRAEVEEELRGLFGPSIDLSPESVEGQFSLVTNEREAVLWELLELLAGVIDPSKLSGSMLEALCALTLTFRRPPSFSVVNVILTGTPSAVIVGGSSLINTQTGSTQFQIVGDAEIVATVGWAPSTAYDEGDIVTTAGQIYRAKSAVADTIGEPTHTTREGATFHPQPSHYWLWLGEGTGHVETLARAVEAGPVFAAAHALEVIDTPASGWGGVVNLLDVTPGRVQQSDEDLRLTREAELAALGGSPVDALRGRLLKLPGVIAATVFFNNTDTTDSDGIPPHSIEAMVRGGDDDAIRALLWATVSAGILTHGTETGIVVDSQGREQTIRFSRPEALEIYVDVSLVKDPLTYPLDGDEQVKAAIVAYGERQQAGKDAVASRIAAAAFDVDGVLDVTVAIDTAPSPSSSATIPVSLRQLAVYDTGRINVTTNPGVP
jgi:uncharacterized phage protein gp47/JayE